MRELNKVQSVTFLIGAMLMVAGAGMTIFRLSAASYIFAIGAVLYTIIQMMQSYEGHNMTIKRLRRIMLLSDVLLLFTAFLMFATSVKLPFIDWLTYVQYIKNNWVVTLLLAALLQLYTVFRIDKELQEEAKKL